MQVIQRDNKEKEKAESECTQLSKRQKDGASRLMNWGRKNSSIIQIWMQWMI